jgi:hypothetical protein
MAAGVHRKNAEGKPDGAISNTGAEFRDNKLKFD